ncbi:helix-turn-helix domain-containing protein [Streptomyces sp. WI04-05B]|uniref:helix-turn-helix domain-containing protein n=1 Tax=Streptomyces TaxID=1883 RepID=UPI0029ADB295|nr:MULTISPECIES: helix-turn-helix transcriptional regulator [unclassified Streptomyces]MDX2545153.1 helix-turn-helix transcriptional regulator [Streptomyces sp. WI04-05B]MDX2587267.1 helix-turn-helix transcriptional regulator [Streptomyces sp. WI04-05A]MDX3752573.1 helix-turn-helix transcriptional regulator [Streptomyces sp. AK08-02]
MTRTSELGNRTSTVLGRRLGAELLRLRDTSGKTQQQAAEVINATNSKIVKMERGWVPMRDPDIRVLCESYGLSDPKALARLLSLARLDRERRKAKGWWQDSPHPGSLSEYIALEDAASRVRTWQLSLIPGLFQTAEYARSVTVTEGAGVWVDPDEIERLVDIRMRRQARLHDERPLQLYAVVWEAALRQLIGGPDTMRAQLEHLLEVAELPNVRVQVLPFRAGGHPCISGPFTIISFAETEAVDVVHADAIASTVWVENEAESAAYSGFFERTARLSLAPRDSVQLIDTIRQEI